MNNSISILSQQGFLHHKKRLHMNFAKVPEQPKPDDVVLGCSSALNDAVVLSPDTIKNDLRAVLSELGASSPLNQAI